LIVEILDGHIFDRRRPKNPRIGYDNIETFANKGENTGSERMCTLGISEIRRDGISTAARRADLINNRLSRIRAVAIVDNDARTHGGQVESYGASDAAGRTRDESGFVCEQGHRVPPEREAVALQLLIFSQLRQRDRRWVGN
jgi:hypothetical protein